ncbi:MAG: hypothetical protein JWR72_3399 [Flavisolibacter sp.]|nr:hypothetical protein [Flavisolibacter sp.]
MVFGRSAIKNKVSYKTQFTFDDSDYIAPSFLPLAM